MIDAEVMRTLRRHAKHTHTERAPDAYAAVSSFGHRVTPTLLHSLFDEDADVRILAAELLEFTELNETVMRALIVALEDPERLVRVVVVNAVGRYGRRAVAALPVLEKWLNDSHEYSRLLAIDAITKIDPEQIDLMLPRLVEILGSDDAVNRSFAAEVVGNLGEGGTPALPVLRSLLNDELASARCRAGIAIWKITGDPPAAIEAGIGLLSSVDWLDRAVGAEHLGSMGAVAASALPALRAALLDHNVSVRETVAEAIADIEAATESL